MSSHRHTHAPHGADRPDATRRPAQHLLRLVTDGENFLVAPVRLFGNGHDAGLGADQPLSAHVDQRVSRPEIDGQVTRENPCDRIEDHGAASYLENTGACSAFPPRIGGGIQKLSGIRRGRGEGHPWQRRRRRVDRLRGSDGSALLAGPRAFLHQGLERVELLPE